MTEDLLNDAQWHAVVEHVRREGVTQRVRRDVDGEACSFRVALENNPETLSRKTSSPQVQEESSLVTMAQQAGLPESMYSERVSGLDRE